MERKSLLRTGPMLGPPYQGNTVSSGIMPKRQEPLGKGKIRLQYTFVIEVDKENYFEGEDPVEVELSSLNNGEISFDALFEDVLSVEVCLAPESEVT